MASREQKEAFVTLATNDTYALGCLVLGSSLRRVGTTRQLAVMVTPGVSQSLRDHLSRVFDLVFDVDLLDSRDPTNLQLLGRPDLNVTFTKFHCWKLTMFDKAVFLDADTLVLQNVDELFDREELSAAPDAGWPDCFNSGVFVFKPSEDTYKAILQFALDQGSFDGGDQGLLNMFFSDWATKDISRHLPFVYNVVSQAFYSYLPAFKQFKDQVKIVHFIGATKPWHQPIDTSTGKVNPLPGSGHNQEFLQFWWTIFMADVQPSLDPNLISMLTAAEGLIGQLATLRIQGGDTYGPELSSEERKRNWEKGQVDYLGADSFENIKRRLDESLNGPAEPPKPQISPFARPSSSEKQQPKESVSSSSSSAESVSERIQPSVASESAAAPKPEVAPKPKETTVLAIKTAPVMGSIEAAKVETTKEPPKPAPEVLPKLATSPKEDTLTAGSKTGPEVAPKPSSPTASGPKEAPKTAPKPTTPTSIAPKPTTAIAQKPATPNVAPKPTTPTSVAPKPTSPMTTGPVAASRSAQGIPSKDSPKPTPTSAPKEEPKIAPPGVRKVGPKLGLAAAQKEAHSTETKGSPGVPKSAPVTFPKPSTPTGPTSGVASKFGPTVAPKPATPTSTQPSAASSTPGAASKEQASSKPGTTPTKRVFNPFASKFGK